MYKLGVVGGGVMGAALIKGILAAGLQKPEAIFLVEPDHLKLKSLQDSLGINHENDLSALAAECRVIILAVKPQVIGTVLKELTPALTESHLVLSIAAGIALNSLEKYGKAKFVRVMPNTPARIGKGVSAYCMGKNCILTDREIVEAIFGCVGIVFEVIESQMHAITALSGSGPAYVYYFIESLIDAGVMLGLPRDIASMMVTQTLLGSAELLKASGEYPAKLKNEVTSPGGTTAAGLFELEKGAVTAMVMKAVQAAAERSRELAQSIS
jgi:pyrroline-5-carboxylate reductase